MSNTEQILTTAVGATIGFFIGGPLGALQGAQYGLLAGGILFPAALPPVTGPRLEDFQALKADPGSPIPLGWGTFAVQGFYLYAGEPIEHATTEEVGGKGGGGQEVTTFSYTQTLAVGICEGPIEGISRIWENGKLVYDGRPKQHGESEDDYQNRLAMSAQYADTLTLYLGSEDQEPDPTLEAELGAGAVPAFRGLAYIVFPDRQLQQDQGLRHPLFKIEVAKAPLLRAPTLTELDPSLVYIGSNGFTLTVTGTNFQDGAVVEVAWDGEEFEEFDTTFVSDTELQVTVSDQHLLAAREVPVRVRNPDGMTSNQLALNVEGFLSLSNRTVVATGNFNADIEFLIGANVEPFNGALRIRNNDGTQHVPGEWYRWWDAPEDVPPNFAGMGTVEIRWSVIGENGAGVRPLAPTSGTSGELPQNVWSYSEHTPPAHLLQISTWTRRRFATTQVGSTTLLIELRALDTGEVGPEDDVVLDYVSAEITLIRE